MAYTAQQVIDLAVQRSALNDPDLVPDAQLLGYMSNSERRVYLMAARMNPNYFGQVADSETRTAVTDGWDLTATPGNVAAVTRLTVKTIAGTVSGVSVGDEINLVDYRYPQLQLSPRAYIRGQTVYSYSTELGAATGNMVTVLNVYYSELPSAITTTTQNVNIPDEWIDLLIVPLARILAIRDKREQEAQFFDQEYSGLLQQFQEEVIIFEHGATRPLHAVPAIPLQQRPAGP